MSGAKALAEFKGLVSEWGV